MFINCAACLGKVPDHGDFVRHRASTPTMRSFDKWLRRGLHYARRHAPSDWERTYDEASTIRFLFWDHRSRAPNGLLGVLRPSRDKGGRAYPFLVACEIPPEALTFRRLPYLPVRAASFYDAAEALVLRATRGHISYQEIPEAVRAMDPDVRVQPTIPRAQKRFLQTETLGTFLESLSADFGDSDKCRLFGNLLEELLPLQEFTSTPLDYGLQFPLYPSAEDQINVSSFWLDLVLRILEYPSIHPSVFWMESRDGVESSPLNLFFGAPDPSSLFGILAPSRANGRIHSLHPNGEKSSTDAALAIPETYGAMLENEQVRLWDFLRRV